MRTIQLGEVTIDRVVELSQGSLPTTAMLPEATAADIAKHHDWLAPHFLDPHTGDLRSSIHTYVVRTPQQTILIDTCIGNGKPRPERPQWHLRQGTFLEDLAALGVTPEAVDLVICTHLHVDHVGWNTRLVDGVWQPTFPRATYLFAGEEWEFWRSEHASRAEANACIGDSVWPVVAAGQVRLVDSDYIINDYLRFEPSPGHTPGHVCLRLTTGAGEAVFCGDLMHRPVQVAEPQWSSIFCVDPVQSRATRQAFVEQHADTDTLILAAHFPTPGRIVRHGGGFRFVPVL
ncbi:MAG: MBL fold metallo-hydrolase [Candidatus Tectimicrobiota bacterium]|nr:MAG: MBL fold metallo-hydrolase [Candidatus Tectomicrobia bacterium]